MEKVKNEFNKVIKENLKIKFDLHNGKVKLAETYQEKQNLNEKITNLEQKIGELSKQNQNLIQDNLKNKNSLFTQENAEHKAQIENLNETIKNIKLGATTGASLVDAAKLLNR